MGHSFCDFRGKMVEVNDSAIQNLIKLMEVEALQIFPEQLCSEELRQIFTDWNNACENSAVGCIDLELNRTVSSDALQELMLLLLDRVQKTAESQVPLLSKEFLTKNIGPYFRGKGVETRILIRDLQKLRSLFKEELNHGVMEIPEEM